MDKILMWGVIASFAFICSSCEEFCEVSDRVAIVVNFYSSETDENTAVNVIVTGINVDGAGNDSVLYPNTLFPQSSREQLLLPINPGADEMIFAIEKDENPADTLIFRYTRNVGFISAECGCAVFAIITGIFKLQNEKELAFPLIFEEEKEEEEEEEEEETQHTILDIRLTNNKTGTVLYRQGIENAENIRIYY